MELLRWLLPRHRFCCDALDDAHTSIRVLQRRLDAATSENQRLEQRVALLEERHDLDQLLLSMLQPPTT